jgi:DNA-binding NarL/FixJ family response regulator
MIERLRALAPAVPVIVLTVYDHQEVRDRARAAGARAFVRKQGDVERLTEAIRRVVTFNSAA